MDKKELFKKITPTPMVQNALMEHKKIEIIERHFKEIMKTLGLDLTDDSLKETPKRVAKMYVKEIFGGLSLDNFPKMTTIENKMNCNEMITISDINVISVCEHHFVTIDGLAKVSYIPDKKIIGLSKINRIVKFFSQRPQVQERLTIQIADCLQAVLETENVAVSIKAKHYCVAMRGIEDVRSLTTTTELRGGFKSNPTVRAEYLKV